MLVDSARNGRYYFHLASPLVRTGIPVSDFGLLALAALFDGQGEYASASRHALRSLKAMGRRPSKDGKPIEDDDEATAGGKHEADSGGIRSDVEAAGCNLTG
jgi:hypothetical protein